MFPIVAVLFFIPLYWITPLVVMLEFTCSAAWVGMALMVVYSFLACYHIFRINASLIIDADQPYERQCNVWVDLFLVTVWNVYMFDAVTTPWDRDQRAMFWYVVQLSVLDYVVYSNMYGSVSLSDVLSVLLNLTRGKQIIPSGKRTMQHVVAVAHVVQCVIHCAAICSISFVHAFYASGVLLTVWGIAQLVQVCRMMNYARQIYHKLNINVLREVDEPTD